MSSKLLDQDYKKEWTKEIYSLATADHGNSRMHTSWAMAASSRHVTLASSEGFRIMQLPAARAGATFQVAICGQNIVRTDDAGALRQLVQAGEGKRVLAEPWVWLRIENALQCDPPSYKTSVTSRREKCIHDMVHRKDFGSTTGTTHCDYVHPAAPSLSPVVGNSRV